MRVPPNHPFFLEDFPSFSIVNHPAIKGYPAPNGSDESSLGDSQSKAAASYVKFCPGLHRGAVFSLRCKDDATRCASSSISKRLWLRVLTCDHSVAASMTGTKHGGVSSSLADLGDFPATFSFEPPAQKEHVQSTAATLRRFRLIDPCLESESGLQDSYCLKLQSLAISGT